MSDIARQPVVRLRDGAVRGASVGGVSAFQGADDLVNDPIHLVGGIPGFDTAPPGDISG